MTLGRVLAFDYGTVRIGVALSDPLRLVASPLTVIDASDPIPEVQRLVEEYQPDVIVVGLPVHLSGREGESAEAARGFAQEVGTTTGIEVVLIDERFTSTQAERALIEGGAKRRVRRKNTDKLAAALILRDYLERMR